MPFSPAVYNAQVAAALNALESDLDTREDRLSERYHMFTKFSGTDFEADLLLSLSGLKLSGVGRVLSAMSYETDAQKKLLDAFVEADAFPLQIMAVVTELRGLIKTNRPARTTPAFRDTLFGPRVAQVLNALLAAEVSGPGRHYFWPRYAFTMSCVTDRQPFALLTDKGTAAAADLLVLQHSSCQDELATFLRMNADDFGVKAALFYFEPRFVMHDDPNAFKALFQSAIGNVRSEMYRVATTVDNRAVPVLMAKNRRLGCNSPLGRMEVEILDWIVRLVLG
jgi:hypothetical protein